MLTKNNLNRLIISCLALVLVLGSLPVNSFASDSLNPSKRHLRGAWISTVINLDWPSTEVRDIKNDKERIQKTKAELIKILEKSVEMNMNTVFFQVSPEGDAFYKSNIVPWSRYLTGTFGKDPGFDPLEFVIEEGHKRNLEIHAWFNPYRVSMYTDEAMVESLNINKSVFKEHPQWIKTASSRFVIDPGIPEAREWVKKRVMEVVNNYDIDGIHFDDYFYNEAYEGELDDLLTFAKYNPSKISNIRDWRRNNTYLLVKEISNAINMAKPWVKFGISPTAVWANKKDGHPDGSNTSAGVPNYDRSFADTKKWVEEEIIDYIAPQIYFSFDNPYVPYKEALSWWSKLIKNKNVHLYIGQALYKVNQDSDLNFQNNKAIEEFTRQHKLNINNPEVMGSIMFRFKSFYDTDKQHVVNKIEKDLWSQKSLVPIMNWKGGQAPERPTKGKIESLASGNKLTWIDKDNNTNYYAIYRINKNSNTIIDLDINDMELIGTAKKSNNSLQEFIDRENNNSNNMIYAVTALDRLHHESKELIIGTQWSSYFSDVNKNYAWAVEAVDYLYEKGIINGIGDGKFAPQNNVSRADFLIMVMNAYGIKLDSNIVDNFSDAGNKYYTAYLGTAKKLKLIEGIGDNLYLPEAQITRQDMFVILYRVLDRLEKLPMGLENRRIDFDKFEDISEIDDYAIEAIRFFVNSRIVQGDNNKLAPKVQATRAESAQVIYNILK